MSLELFWDSAFLWRDAMLTATIGAALLGYLGFFIVLTRHAFVSAVVSQLAGLGVVLALLTGATLGFQLPPLVCGTVLGILGTVLLARPRPDKRLANDAVLATAVVGSSALTLLAAHHLTEEYQHVQAALFGDAVVASRDELLILTAIAIATSIVHILFRHRFMLVIFDPDSARAQGMRVTLWAVLLGLSLGLGIATVTRAIGALTAFAFSVVPASAGLWVGRSLRHAVGIALGLACLAAVGGYLVSFFADLPTGPSMVLSCLLGAGLVRVVRR